MDRWKGRVALVTGASVGIGASICRALVAHGLKVVGCARNVDQIKAIASEDEVRKGPGSLHAVKCDLTQESDILSLFKEIRQTYGRIDICINNAGMAEMASLMSGKTEMWRTMLDVNVMALCICTREAITLMKEAGVDDGQIIHISSMAGHRVPSLAGVTFYSGTKFMVRALTEGLRKELREAKSNIRVSSISPGMVETEFFYRMSKDDPERAKQAYSKLKCLQGSDISDMVVYILQCPPHVDITDVLLRPTEQAI